MARLSIVVVTVLVISGCYPCPKAARISQPCWLPQESGVKESFRGLCVVSDKVVWASGTNGTFLKTTDGGTTWQASTVPGAESRDFRDIQAFDENTAYVVAIAEPAEFYKTIDGGKSWTRIYYNDTAGIFFGAIAFWDHNRAIAASDPIQGYFPIITTDDGGATWQQITPLNIPAPEEGEGQFAASGTFIAVQPRGKVWIATGGSVARVFRSKDFGRTWKVSDTPLICGLPSTGGFSIAFRDERNGIVVGGDYKKINQKTKNAAFTIDGGATWTLVQPCQPSGFREGVAYVPGSSPPMVVTVGPSGSDYSIDDGRSWHNFDKTAFHAVGFAPTGAGWAVGINGRIAKFNLSPPQ